MSNGALTQLVAVGAQESNFLSTESKDSVFVEPTKKINNFVKSTISMQPLGSSNFGSITKFKIEKKGDLLNSIYFVAKLPKLDRSYLSDTANTHFVRWVDYIGNVLLESVKLYIGGQLIDEQTGDFIQIYTDLYDDDWNKLCLIGLDDTLTTPAETVDSTYVYVPLKFWFCNSLKKSLPLISLQYHDIELEVKIRDWDSCYQVLKKTTLGGEEGFHHVQSINKMTQQVLEGVRLDCNYIYLDSEERKRFAEKEHKILITQSQQILCGLGQGKTIELDFNHPVKEMFFYIQNNDIKNLPDPYNFSFKPEYASKTTYDDYLTQAPAGHKKYTSSIKRHFLGEARLLINGYTRINWNDYKYYYFLQNYENYRNKLEHYVYLYSFSGNPKSETPMGSLNFSRVDNAQLQITMNESSKTKNKVYLNASNYGKLDDSNHNIVAYGINYNYLIIRNGMAGLAYKT